MEAISGKTIFARAGQADTLENTVLIMRALGVDLSKARTKYKKNYVFQAMHLLLGRNLVLFLSAYESIVTGFYATGKALKLSPFRFKGIQPSFNLSPVFGF